MVGQLYEVHASMSCQTVLQKDKIIDAPAVSWLHINEASNPSLDGNGCCGVVAKDEYKRG